MVKNFLFNFLLRTFFIGATNPASEDSEVGRTAESSRNLACRIFDPVNRQSEPSSWMLGLF